MGLLRGLTSGKTIRQQRLQSRVVLCNVSLIWRARGPASSVQRILSEILPIKLCRELLHRRIHVQLAAVPDDLNQSGHFAGAMYLARQALSNSMENVVNKSALGLISVIHEH